MIYTSYFAKLRALPKNVIPIAICAKVPEWYAGLHYPVLAPKYQAFAEYKKNGDFEQFAKQFREQVLSECCVEDVLDDLAGLAASTENATSESQICLICYEKPTDNCHRHLVAQWFRENDIDCQEWA